MRTVRFHGLGEPAEVLLLEEVAIPEPRAGRIRVHTCGLNPADWAPCRRLAPGNLPRGIGLEVSGIVDALPDYHLKTFGELTTTALRALRIHL
jgi:NADPH:quinone reductase-like Zn-dependent oxidoreductase